MSKRKTYAAHNALKTKGPTTKVPFNKEHKTNLSAAGGQAGAHGHPHYPNGHHVQKITKKPDKHVDGNHIFHVRGRMSIPDGGTHIASLESPNKGVRTSGAVAPRLNSPGQWLRSPSTPMPPTAQRPPTEGLPLKQHHQLAMPSATKCTKC